MRLVVDVVVVGSASVDLCLGVPQLPQPGQTLLVDERGLTRRPGGKGANQAVAAARLGASTALLGRVGADEDGELLVSALAEAGVQVEGLGRDGSPTGLAVLLVDAAGENSIVVAPGANATLTGADLDHHAALLAGARVVLLSMEVPLAALEHAAQLGGGLVVLNPAPFTALSRGLQERVDVLVPNRGELAALLGVPVPAAVEEAVALARAAPCERVVVTLGADGAVVVDGGQVEHVPAPRVRAVDSVGAGDTFCAALAVGLARSLPLGEATHRAVAAGAVAVATAGAQVPVPRFEDL